MLFTPDERRALLAVAGLLCLGLAVRVVAPGPVPPEGGGDSLLVVIAGEADKKPDEAPPRGLLEEGRIRVNDAETASLEALPGIGPAMAQRIIEERRRNGPFHSLRDLERVRGIGPRTARKLEPHISFAVAAAECTAVPQGATDDSSSARWP